MIPRRLLLKGFMSYREETEIYFTGPAIWALCGANGAGKSTIFDAMLFALYGEHRMGKQNVDALIHREAESFVIEFDFALGENVYRVKRTYARKTKGTMLALHLSGPDMPVPGRTGVHPYAGTATKEGFDAWVLQTVGLNANTFRVAVLLMQGQSDVLLKLGNAERHEVLTHIIDLSRYEALCKLAGSKQKVLEGELKSYTTQLSHLEAVDDAHLLNLEAQKSEAEAKREQARQRHLTLIALKEQAKHWQKLQEDEQRLVENLAQCTALLDQAAQIKQRATRLDNLQKVITPLEQIYHWQREYAGYQTQFEQGREKVQLCEGSLQEQNEKLLATQLQLNALQTQRVEADHEQKALQPRLRELQEVCSKIAHLQSQQQSCEELNQQIAAYPLDLEQQQQDLQKRLEELKHIEDIQPHLKQFTQARTNWQQATQDLTEAKQALSRQEALLKDIETQTHLLSEQIAPLTDQLNNLQSDIASKKTLRDESKKRLDRFKSIDGQPTCSYCGQPLTREHLAAERQRVEAELQECQRVYREALAQQTTITQQKTTLEQKHTLLSQQATSQKQIIDECRARCTGAGNKQNSASAQAGVVLRLLTPDYIALIQGVAHTSIDLEVCLQAEYPTAQDLDELASRLNDKPFLEERLQAVTSDREQRAELVRKRNYIFNEIQPLEQLYPSEHAATLLQEQVQALQRDTALHDDLDKFDKALEQQRQQLKRLEGEKQQTEQQKGQLERTIAIAEINLQHAQRSIAEAQASLPEEWQVQVEQLSERQLGDWKQEMEELAGATEQLRELEQAQQNSDRYRQELLHLKIEQDQIPEGAKQAPEQLKEAGEQANLSYQAFAEQERKLSAEIQRLKGIQDTRRELEQQQAKAARLTSYYKDLTHLLGRDGLQHYLLQKAEAGIVYHANEVLDGISGGMLRLELQSNSEKKAHALDIVAYNTAISVKQPLPLRLLSGSQQFRVAVSLALGIGKYAGNENHRVESVIIDEGFGSLDENGRREMIQAIKELGDGNVLKCIIVVSHQREFVDEFADRYLVELVDGSTQISLV
ncbi:MAG TPA: SMC family ATPase [Ktedonosporobacter sp.]|jgi:DNA repair exonuclease SbcCD ATPase subunit|nr:SMC family ATPase [Ktedonosporobacter sp.]